MINFESGSYEDYAEVYDKLKADYEDKPSVSLLIAFVHCAVNTTRQLGFDSVHLLELVRDSWDKAAE